MEKIRGKQRCTKCGNVEYEVGEAFVAGSFLAKIFDIQNRKFTSVTCTKCQYTEFYKIPIKKIQNALDFVIGT